MLLYQQKNIKTDYFSLILDISWHFDSLNKSSKKKQKLLRQSLKFKDKSESIHIWSASQLS
jgi:hypothetical protein